ncbi:MAG: TetR/AcrR family transcriptional regulator [Ruminococcus sp.]|nr:TetR/AcrR family transcriptional regulator [Ruminococcus sp.]
MQEKKPDKRTLKTRKAITDGLCELLAEKELRSITVQEIADKADVNRVTFYKHYYDIYDLYEKTEKEALSELGMVVLGYRENRAVDFASGMVDYISENKKLFKMLFSPHNTGELRDKFVKMVEGLFRLIQSEKCGTDLGDRRLDFYCGYQANGCISVFEKWVRGDFSQPRDFVVETINGLNRHTEEYISKQIGK